MKLIKGFNINQTDFSAKATSRDYIVNGDDGAVFSLRVRRDSDEYWYDFTANTFVSTDTSRNRLTNKKIKGSFSSSIFFPARAAGDVYTIYLFAEPHFDTKIDQSLSDNPVLYITKLTQVADSTITFSVKSTSYGDKFGTLPTTVTSTGSPLQSGVTVVDIDWNFIGSTSNGNSHGFTLIGQPLEDHWITRTALVVSGTTSSSTEVNIIRSTGVYVGMTLREVSSGSLSGEPSVTNVNIANTREATLTLSSAQSFADGITLTFQDRGSNQIARSHGFSFANENFTSGLANSNYDYYDEGGTKANESYHTVRSAPSNSTTVTISPNTLGIAGGATVRGINVVNTGANAIQAVGEDETSANDGSIVLQINQQTTLVAKTALYIDGSSFYANIKGEIHIKSYPTNNLTVYLDLDKILIPGGPDA